MWHGESVKQPSVIINTHWCTCRKQIAIALVNRSRRATSAEEEEQEKVAILKVADRCAGRTLGQKCQTCCFASCVRMHNPVYSYSSLSIAIRIMSSLDELNGEWISSTDKELIIRLEKVSTN